MFLFKAGIAVSIKAITYIPKNEPGCGLTALHADFTYSISPDTIAIIDTTLGKRSVTNDIENVLRKIQYWHQGSIAVFKIMYRDEQGIWDGVNWDGLRASFIALREKDEKMAWEKLREARTC
jgi:hypothetical protein